MKNGNPIYKLLFKYHVNMIEVCNIRQCLGLISDDKAEQTNKKHTLEDSLLMKSKNFLEIKENWAASNGSFFFAQKSHLLLRKSMGI